MALNVTTAVIGSGCNTATASPSLAQWDQGQVLKIEGVDLPAAYQVEFSTEYTRNAIPQIGDENGVAIPNELLQRSAPITAYIVLHEGLNDREREYWITIYITPGTPPETITPDPEQMDVIDETIAALQAGVAAAEAAAESVQNMGVEAETLTPGSPLTVTKEVDPETGAVTLIFGLTQGPKGDDGYSPTITITTITGGHRFTVTDQTHPSGQSFDVLDGTKGDKGDDGYSPVITITTITGGHRFTVTDKTHPSGQSFDVLDGAKGDKGDDGYSPVVTITTITGGHRVTITDKTHPSGQTFDVMDGVIQSVNGKSAAAITIDSGDIEFDDSVTYAAGSIGAEVSDAKNAIGELNRQLSDETTGLDTKAPVIINTASGAIASFDDGADSMPIRKLVAQIEPVQDLHGYSNPWPAGGGANQWDEQWEAGGLNIANGDLVSLSNAIRTKNFVPVLPNTTYYRKSTANILVLYYANDQSYLNNYIGWGSNNTFTTPADCYYLKFYTFTDYGSTYKNDIAINYPATVTNYSPYANICNFTGLDGITINRSGEDLEQKDVEVISWSSFGTVYNGTADLLEGAGTSTTAKLVLDGSSNWREESTRNGFYLLVSGMKSSKLFQGKCNQFKVAKTAADMNSQGVAIGYYNNALFFTHVTDTMQGIEDIDDWKAYLQVNPIEITYPTSAVQSFAFESIQIKTLNGTNNIWADEGCILNVSYCADTKLYVDTMAGWAGKKYAAIGDSITWGFTPRNTSGYRSQLQSYAALTAKKLGMSFENYGIAGCTFAVLQGHETDLYPIATRWQDLPDDADLITVTGGTNDVRLGVPLGTMADRGTDTYYGAWHTVLGGLYKKYFIDQGVAIGKEKKIVVITPIKLLSTPASTEGGNGTLLSWDAWIDAIKEVAAYYSFPVIDFYTLSNINPHLNGTVYDSAAGYVGYYNQYITDGVHPTQEGAEIMSNVLVGFLNTII